jgi:hypothetical protein
MLLAILLPAMAYASSDDVFEQAHSVGGSGWDIYSDDEDYEEETAEQRVEREERERLAEEEQLRKKERRKDFFSLGVDVYDKGLSRTANEEKKLKSGE